MFTAIKIKASKSVLLSNIIIKDSRIGIDIEKSSVRIRRVIVGNTLVPLVIRDFDSQVIFEDDEGLIVY